MLQFWKLSTQSLDQSQFNNKVKLKLKLNLELNIKVFSSKKKCLIGTVRNLGYSYGLGLSESGKNKANMDTPETKNTTFLGT